MAIVEQAGDLWSFHELGYRIVVPTSVGWNATTRRNQMQTGIAARVAALDAIEQPDIAAWYGRWCKEYQAQRGVEMPVVEHRALRLIFLPDRPLVSVADSDRADAPANLGLLQRGLDQIAQLCERGGRPIAMSLVGMGEGLPRASVRQSVEQRLEQYTVNVLGRSKRLVLVTNDVPALGAGRAQRVN